LAPKRTEFYRVFFSIQIPYSSENDAILYGMGPPEARVIDLQWR